MKTTSHHFTDTPDPELVKSWRRIAVVYVFLAVVLVMAIVGAG